MKILIRDIDKNIGNNRTEREKEAVRTLVAEAFGPQAIKNNLPSGEPIISIGGIPVDEAYSITHCADVAVLVVNDGSAPLGVDAEQYRDQLRRVVHKFLSPEESAFYSSDEALLTAWSLKEATYKAAHTPGLALVDIHLPLNNESLIITAKDRKFRILESRYIRCNVMMSAVVGV